MFDFDGNGVLDKKDISQVVRLLTDTEQNDETVEQGQDTIQRVRLKTLSVEIMF